jgi:hypothetical protein
MVFKAVMHGAAFLTLIAAFVAVIVFQVPALSRWPIWLVISSLFFFLFSRTELEITGTVVK